jgi:hypothetical protein
MENFKFYFGIEGQQNFNSQSVTARERERVTKCLSKNQRIDFTIEEEWPVAVRPFF